MTEAEKKVDPLAALEAEAKAIEAAPSSEKSTGSAAAAATPVSDSTEADLKDALTMAAGMIRPTIWWLNDAQWQQTWGESTIKNIAHAGADVMRRHGLTMAGLMGKYGPYIALGAALMPPTLVTVQAYKLAQQPAPQQKADAGVADYG